MPTALETYWTGRVAALAAQKAAADNAFTQARADLQAARDQLAADREDLTTVVRDLDVLRRSLAEPGLSPAELAARVAALRQRTVEFRAAHRAVLDGEGAAALDQRLADARQADLGRALAALAAARAEADAAAAQGVRWADGSAALAAEPLASLKARATQATQPADPVWAAAKERVEADIPAELRARAAARQAATLAAPATARAAVAEIEQLLAAARAPQTGASAAKAATLAAAERALFDHIQRGPATFDHAVARLAAVAASPPLTAAELAAIQDANRVTLGKAAALLEEARDIKAAELAAKRTAVVSLTRQLLAADIDEDLAAHAGLTDLEDEATQLEGELAAAEAAYAAVAGDLEDWEAAVPESAWSRLQAFETARRELTELAARVPANLLAALDGAATDLVTALGQDDEQARTLSYLWRETTDELARHEVVQTFAERRVASAVRGE